MPLGPALSFYRAARVLRILASNSRVSAAPTEEAVLVENGQLDTYAPIGSHSTALVLLHGVTARGARDRQLVRLARVLAAEGVASYVPHLPGLAEFREDLGDLRQIEHAISLASFDGRRRVSVLGFSLGGGYGLCCAAAPNLARSIARVTVVGAHHRLDEVWSRMSLRLHDLPACLERASENDLYCALGRAEQRLDLERLGAKATEALQTLLWNYCDGVDLGVVREFVASSLVPHWPIIEECQTSERSLHLSPAGRLKSVLAPVDLIHAPDDELIPQCHAAENFRELSDRSGNVQSLLTTKLLCHVRPRLSESWRELPRLVKCFADLLG